MASPEMDDLNTVRLDTALNLSDLQSENGLLMNTLDAEENCHYEGRRRHNLEMYYEHDDLMKYVDLSVSESLTECDRSPFEILKSNMTDITDNTGKVFKKVVRAGVGEVCPSDSVVKFHYVAFKEGEEVPYDVSRLRRKFPESVKLGSDALILGLELGISSMRLNEESHFLIHPDYAYGPLGVGERIPPNATLLFKVELLGIQNMELPETEEYSSLQEGHSFDKLYEKAKAHIKKGNHVKTVEKNNGAAIKEFRAAINILLKTPLDNEEEEKKKKHAITRAYINLIVCLSDDNMYRKMCIAYKDALYEGCEEATNNPKLIFYHAKAQCGLHDFDQAERLFLRVKSLDPKAAGKVDIELNELRERRRRSRQEERLLYGRMFQ